MNAINLIIPYRYEGMWVFDDARVGLDKEPFVSGADMMLDVLVNDIPNAQKGFRLLFSATPFPGYKGEAGMGSRGVWGQLVFFASIQDGGLEKTFRTIATVAPGSQIIQPIVDQKIRGDQFDTAGIHSALIQ